jgi:hypothetical protein
MEQAFCVLPAWWAIIHHLARTWSLKIVHEVMTCCVIMHNIIVKTEHPDGLNDQNGNFRATWFIHSLG